MKKQNLYTVIVFLFLFININAQYGFGTKNSNPNSVAHFYSMDSTKGVIIPAVTTAKRPLAANSLQGMLIYNKTNSCVQFCDGIKWVCIDSVGPDVDSLKFNYDTLYLYEDNKLLTTYINPSLDTALVDSLILAKVDTLYSLFSDSLINDSVFLDSLAARLKDSIDTDIDSVKYESDSLYVYEDDKKIVTYLGIGGGSSNSENGDFVAYGINDLTAWDASSNSWNNTFFSGAVDSVVISNGYFVAYGPNDLTVWNTVTNSWTSETFSGAVDGVVALNGDFVAYGTNDLTAWDASSNSWNNTFFSGAVDSVVISNGYFVAYGPNDLKVWNTVTNSWSSTFFSGAVDGVVKD